MESKKEGTPRIPKPSEIRPAPTAPVVKNSEVRALSRQNPNPLMCSPERVRQLNERAGRVGQSPITREELLEVWSRYSWSCPHCSRTPTTWDHVIPLKHGGTNTSANLRPTCLQCNWDKGSKLPSADCLENTGVSASLLPQGWEELPASEFWSPDPAGSLERWIAYNAREDRRRQEREKRIREQQENPMFVYLVTVKVPRPWNSRKGANEWHSVAYVPICSPKQKFHYGIKDTAYRSEMEAIAKLLTEPALKNHHRPIVLLTGQKEIVQDIETIVKSGVSVLSNDEALSHFAPFISNFTSGFAIEQEVDYSEVHKAVKRGVLSTLSYAINRTGHIKTLDRVIEWFIGAPKFTIDYSLIKAPISVKKER